MVFNYINSIHKSTTILYDQNALKPNKKRNNLFHNKSFPTKKTNTYYINNQSVKSKSTKLNVYF